MVTNRQRYREKVSQMISWGHWFALFNILLALGLGSRYLFVTDWPASLLGRVYALVSLLGHFSFIVFAGYLLVIFPLTFVVMSQRLLRLFPPRWPPPGSRCCWSTARCSPIFTCTSIRWCGIWWSTRIKASCRATGS